MAVRLPRAALDDAILDVAAGLFALRGFRGTSVQSIADATGYSKGAILARFTSKEQLFDAVVDRCVAMAEELSTSVEMLPEGDERDAQAIAGFVNLSMSHPGNGALLMAAILSPDQEIRVALDRTTPFIWSMFGADFADARAEMDASLLPADILDRRVRVVSALGGITSVVAATQAAPIPGMRSLLSSIAAKTLQD